MIQLGVAAGAVKTIRQVRALAALPSDVLGAITVGSFTLEPRPGNSNDGRNNVFWTDGHENPTTLNSLGLPNPGLKASQDMLTEMAKIIRGSGKVARISIAGFSVEDYVECAEHVPNAFDEMEINFGCPNVRKDNGEAEAIMSFSIDRMHRVITGIEEATDSSVADGVKVSPYTDEFMIKDVCHMLAETTVRRLVTCNTFPNCVAFNEDGGPVITTNPHGYAGLAGLPLLKFSAGQVSLFRKYLPDDFDITGVGGISSGAHVFQQEQAGANRVQVGSAFFVNEDPQVFVDIASSYPYGAQ